MRFYALQQPNISFNRISHPASASQLANPIISGFRLFGNRLVLLETCLALHYKSSRPPPTLTTTTLKSRPTALEVTQYGELYGKSFSIVSRCEA